MGVPDLPLGLQAARPEPVIDEGEALAAMIVLAVLDPRRAAVAENRAVPRHAVGNAGEQLREMQRRIGIVADAEKEHLPVDGMAEPLRAFLGREPGPARRLRGGAGVSAKPSLTLVRRIKAPPGKVYAAWTRPEMMVAWWGPHNTRVASAEADARIGGRFRVVMMEDNGERHEVSGTYSEVEPERKLAFSWAWVTMPERESRVAVMFRAVAEGTELTVLHEQFADEPARIGHEQGWNEALERLESLFQAGGAA